MGQHKRVPLLAILARLNWSRSPNNWTIKCWDGAGRRSSFAVRLGYGFLTFQGPSVELVYLSPKQAGQLRRVLREAVFELDRLGGEALPDRPEPIKIAGTTMSAATKSAVLLTSPSVRTVAEIAMRLAAEDRQAGVIDRTDDDSRRSHAGDPEPIIPESGIPQPTIPEQRCSSPLPLSVATTTSH